MKRKKRCLVLLDKPIKEQEKNNLKILVKDNFKYFYFIENNNINKTASEFLRKLAPDIKCYNAHYYKIPCWEKTSFSLNLPILSKTKDEKLLWGIKSSDIIISNIKNLPKSLKKANLVSIY